MAASTRLYVVSGPNNTQHLVRATNPSQATGAITKKAYTAKPASADEAVQLRDKGVEVIEAGKAAVLEGVPENV